MKIRVPATSANLGPGFDCLGLALNLFNEVKIQEAKAQSIEIKGFGEDDKTLAKKNLFIEIFKTEFELLSKEKCEFSFKFNNQIPFSRGLGSSSAVIISALAAAFFMAGKKASKKEILNAALKYENHPDNIAPATLGGFVCALIENQNELFFDKKKDLRRDKILSVNLKENLKKDAISGVDLKQNLNENFNENLNANSSENFKENLQVFSIKKSIDKNLKALVCIPPNAFNTELSRLRLAKKVSFKDAVFNTCHASFLTACFLSRKYELLRLASKDKLHQMARMKELNELFSVQKCALQNGALMSTLSGSGSSFFNLVYSEDAPKIAQKMRKKFAKFEFKILDFNDKGLEIC